MYQGTTPLHTYEIDDLDTTLIKTIKITYTQNEKEILVKRTEDCTITPGKISTKLSQEDTFLFDGDSLVTIQLRILTHEGDALRTDSIILSVDECLDNEVLV
jgi:hypothetical protein